MSGRRRPDGSANVGDLDLFAGGAPSRVAPRAAPPAIDRPLAERPAGFPGAAPGCALAVSELTSIAKDILEGAFQPLWVRGEVSDFKSHRNGHWYFCLRDAAAQVRCVIWSSDQRRIIAPPDEGMQIVARGQLTVYPARGDVQLIVSALDAVGDGLHRKALDVARERLAAEGLLDPARKRPLPRLPRVVAVVTSADGAALHDIIAVVRRRCACVQLVVVPTKVQGEGAPGAIIAAIERATRWGGADVLIVGRGGGAREDLWAFNDIAVARALAMSPIPTISAVGHEVDITLCDLVADVRAATPSAAAECAVPVLAEEIVSLRAQADALRGAVGRRIDAARRRVDRTTLAMKRGARVLVDRRRARADVAAARLHALSPLAARARGVAVARDEGGRPLMRASDFAPGAAFALTLRDGVVRAHADGEPGP
ncbi:MAG: exodeoxyribonuclease VII large subunit [Gemmatimonadaceae bacterium]